MLLLRVVITFLSHHLLPFLSSLTTAQVVNNNSQGMHSLCSFEFHTSCIFVLCEHITKPQSNFPPFISQTITEIQSSHIMSTSEYHDEEDPSFSLSPPPAPPDPKQDKKRNRLTKMLSRHLMRDDIDEDKLTSQYDIDRIDEEEFQKFAKKAFATYDENRDGVLDEMEMNRLLRDAYTMGGKNLALKQANAKQTEKTRQWKRTSVGAIVISVFIVAAMIVQFFFFNQSNVRDGSETREEVKRTKVLEVGSLDEAGYGHLQDVSGIDLRKVRVSIVLSRECLCSICSVLVI